MSRTLAKVKESIKTAEKIKIETPEYYDKYWKNHHKVLLKVQTELKEKDENL